MQLIATKDNCQYFIAKAFLLPKLIIFVYMKHHKVHFQPITAPSMCWFVRAKRVHRRSDVSQWLALGRISLYRNRVWNAATVAKPLPNNFLLINIRQRNRTWIYYSYLIKSVHRTVIKLQYMVFMNICILLRASLFSFTTCVIPCCIGRCSV